jgi:ankyrin repeat protein
MNNLIDAIRENKIEQVRLLLQDPRVDRSVFDNFAIQMAAGKGHLEVVQLLLQDPRVDATANNNFAIRMAAGKGHLEVVRLLLQDPRVNPTDQNNQAIRLAVDNDHPEVVLLLATIPGILVDVVNYYLVTGNFSDIKRLAKMTGCLSNTDEDSLVWAAAIGSLNLVKLLTNQGIDPTFANNSAVIAAQQYGQIEVRDYLLTLPGVILPEITL